MRNRVNNIGFWAKILWIVECVLILYAFSSSGQDVSKLLEKKIIVRLYNGVIEIGIPELSYDGEEEHGVFGVILPAFKYNYDMIKAENVDEDKSEYSRLVKFENEKMDCIIDENQAKNAKKSNKKSNRDVKKKKKLTDKNHNKSCFKIENNSISMEKLKDFDYLRKHFYQIDSTTTISSGQLNASKLMGMDMSIKEKKSEPQILIYHTHSQEGYVDSQGCKKNTTVVDVGDYLADILKNKYNYSVLHHKGKYDVNGREHAYSNALPALEKLLKDNPSIEVVIDLHRDGVAESTRLITNVKGKRTAKIMFFNGLSRTTAQGDIYSLKNPYIKSNLAFSLQMEINAEKCYPELTRKIYLKGYRYNMHLCPKSLLVEVGAQTNTAQEAINAMEPLAEVLHNILR